jgi:hypothetical protein
MPVSCVILPWLGLLGLRPWIYYPVCSCYVNDLGLLSVLDSQYIIGGLLPMTLLGLPSVSLYFAGGIKRIPFIPVRLRINKVLYYITVLSVALYVILGLILHSIGHFSLDTHALLNKWFFSGISLWGYVYVILLFATGRGLSRLYPPRIYFAYLLALGLMIWAIGQYALVIYPNIPHSLGGAKPRCAYLDVDISKISADSRSTLFSVDGDRSTTRRSEALDVYYAADNSVLVKKAPTTELEDSDTYEIDRDAINAIIWC